MKLVVAILAMITIVGCQEAEHVRVEPGDISHLKIADFNWEQRQTLVYEVSADEIKLYDSEFPDEILERVLINDESKVWRAINRVSKIYTEQMNDEKVADGTMLWFTFTLKDGTTIKTHVSNLIIAKYAAVTEAISEVLDHQIPVSSI